MSSYIDNVAVTLATLIHIGKQVAQSKLAPLSSYGTIEILSDPFTKGLDAVIPMVTAAPAVQILSRTDSPNYLASGTNTDPISIPVKYFLAPLNVENAATQTGNQIAFAAQFAINQLCNAIVDYGRAYVNVANNGSPVVTVSSASYGHGEFGALGASIDAPQRCLVLDKSYSVKTPATWLPASGNLAVYEDNRWSAAGPNIVGFCATPSAFVFCCGTPDSPTISRRSMETSSFELPQLGGVRVEVSAWFNPNTRTISAGYALYFGAAPADKNALKLLASA